MQVDIASMSDKLLAAEGTTFEILPRPLLGALTLLGNFCAVRPDRTRNTND
jgi:hypothetical protein